MSIAVLKHIQSKLPTFNPDVARGIACVQLQHAEEYIERVLRCAEQGFPPEVKYLISEGCTPYDEINFASAKAGANKRKFDYSRSNVYLKKYTFTFNENETITTHLFLPWVKPGGIITLVGSDFNISPVLADKAISVDDDSIFIPLNRDKLTFRRLLHHYIINGNRIAASVVWANIYHVSKKNRILASRRNIFANATIGHYLFCKYGLQQAFMILTNSTVHVGLPDVINETNYPPSEWYICWSTQDKPSTLRTKFYTPTTIRLAIRKADYNTATAGLISSFFYVCDHFPQRIQNIATQEYLNDPVIWRVLMGYLYFSADELEGKLLSKIDVHIISLDGYVDGMVKEWLQEDGIYVNNVYELFMHIIETYSIRITEAGTNVASMYGKRLMVLRYVLIDIIKAIFGMMFALQVASNKSKRMTKNDVEEIINKFMRPYLIMKINSQHSEVTSASNATDNMAIKLTATMVPQTSITAGGGANKSSQITAGRLLHPSLLEAGQFTNLPKGDPTGYTRCNMYVHTSSTGVILRKPKFIDLLDRVGAEIAR